MKALIRQLRALDRESRRTLGTAVLVPGVLLTLLGVGYVLHAPFAAYVREVLVTFFGLAGTPVVLESLSLFTGTTLLLLFGWLRLVVFGGEWVEEEGGEAAMSEPEEAQVAMAMAEGFLGMGQVEEAHESLLQVPRREWDTPACVAVRLRVATALERWGEARVLAAELEAGGDAFAETLARYEIALADALVRDGSGTTGSRAAEAKSLREKARGRCPELPREA